MDCYTQTFYILQFINFIIQLRLQFENQNQEQMTKYTIINFPNQILKQSCQEITFPLTTQTQQNILSLKQTFRDSFVTHRKATLGLAAPQIGILQRFFIMPKSLNFQDKELALLKSIIRNFNVYINPIILQSTKKSTVNIIQNCLSMGDDCYQVEREQTIQVQYYNTKGQKIVQALSGLRARVFLHQNDHLDGITMETRGVKLTPEQIKLRRVAHLKQRIQTSST